jgi:hypothetical protein
VQIGIDVRRKFEFSRHETFAIREGWLGKGLAHLAKTDSFQVGLAEADALGLGSRMIKSLHYWMEATGLATVSATAGRTREVRPSSFGGAVAKCDPHFEFSATWWFIHLHLARREGTVWNWFFNAFQDRSFDRIACIDAFARHTRDYASNRTTPAVIQREIACLLLTYAAPATNEQPDPEDATCCPLRSLSLVAKHADTGRYERTKPLDPLPVEAFLAAVAAVAQELESETIPLTELLVRRNSPARIFGLHGDAIDDLASLAATTYSYQGVSLALYGADRAITIPRIPVHEWLLMHFNRVLRNE